MLWVLGVVGFLDLWGWGLLRHSFGPPVAVAVVGVGYRILRVVSLLVCLWLAVMCWLSGLVLVLCLFVGVRWLCGCNL